MPPPLSSLLNHNIFQDLGVLPSASNREVRRRLDEVRLEASVGIVAIDEAVLARASSVLSNPGDLFCYRLFAVWADDPSLARGAAEHDAALNLLGSDGFDGCEEWIEFLAHPSTASILGSLADLPPNAAEPLGQTLADVFKAGLLTDGTLERVMKATRSPSEFLQMAFERLRGVDLRPSTLVFVEHARSILDEARLIAERIAELSEADLANLSKAAASDLADATVGALGEAAETQRVLTDAATLATAGGFGAELLEMRRNGGARIAEWAKSLSFEANTPLFRAGYYRESAAIAEAALTLAHSTEVKEQLEEDLRVVTLVWARAQLTEAIARGDNELALMALAIVMRTTDSSEERQEADARAIRLRFSPLRPAEPGAAPEKLRPISKAPSLSTTNGVGTMIYHTGRFDDWEGTKAGTLFFTFLFIPTLPLGRYVFKREGKRYQFFGRVPLRKFDFIYLVLIGIGLAGLAGGALIFSPDGKSATPPTTSPSAIPRVGDCITTTSTATGFTVRVVGCSLPNEGRILFIWSLAGRTYPDAASSKQQATANCPVASKSYVYPTAAGFRAGDREVLCLDR